MSKAANRPDLIRVAFLADNWRRNFTDEEYQAEVANGRTRYIERIVDAIEAERGKE